MNIKGSIRLQIFYGFVGLTLLSVLGVASISFFLIKNKAEQDNTREVRRTIEMLTASLNYAVSRTDVSPHNVAPVLENKILEMADITRKDIAIYNIKGQFLVSNRKDFAQQDIPHHILRPILDGKKQIDIVEYSPKKQANITSSYILLLNHMLDPVAVVYFPFYHDDAVHTAVFQQYLKMMLGAMFIILTLGIGVSWLISKALVRNINSLSYKISKINLNEPLTPIAYYNDDEFTPLVNAYNKTLRLIGEQKELLAFREKESAWREMAKQVAHEVKNPLTPMKLLIQNFERKFDAQDPQIEDKVKKLCKALVGQIDLMTKVANAFSEFTKLPEKHDEIINVHQEIAEIVRVFDEGDIVVHCDEPLQMNFDKTFFQRIMTNLILNAQQAKDENRALEIIITAEKLNKKIHLSIADNGVGIPRDQLDKIFEFNFTTKSSGTGLGLTMVKRMIEDYHGEISIFSKEGKGTKVNIILPVE